MIPLLQRCGVRPNHISAVGLVAGVAAGAALAATSCAGRDGPRRALWLAGAVLIQLRGACNIMDGVLAVETGASSRTGYLWNEFPDRLADAATMIGAGYAVGGGPVAGWAAALAAVITAYARTLARVAGAPMDYRGPMAKPARVALVCVVALYCALTPVSWQPEWGGCGLMGAALWVVAAGCAVTVWRRLRHAAQFLRASGP
jgi:phosphatidylglycerophosphate synthase